eukprot:SAG11_NODE_33370_length_277_cov_2.797753_1_plen_47_part_01
MHFFSYHDGCQQYARSTRRSHKLEPDSLGRMCTSADVYKRRAGVDAT